MRETAGAFRVRINRALLFHIRPCTCRPEPIPMALGQADFRRLAELIEADAPPTPFPVVLSAGWPHG